MQISVTAFFVYFAGLIAIFFCCSVGFRTSTLWKSRIWRGRLFWSVMMNTVLFGGIAIYFYLTYGFITDDRLYFNDSLLYSGNIFTCKTANEFMAAITHPLRTYLHFDLPSCHVLFGTFGFIGSLLFVTVLMARMDFKNSAFKTHHLICFWTLVCFPNFVAWGRFYGKDSTMFFLSGVLVFNVFKALSDQKMKLVNFISIPIVLLVMYRLRPHLFAVLLLSLSLALLIKSYKSRTPDIGLRGIYQVVFPVILAAASIIIFAGVIRTVSRQGDVSVATVQTSFMTASRMGAIGGSTTELAGKLSDDPTVIFRPTQIALNIIQLFFAPLPWQIRGGADILAFVSNFLFFFLIYYYRKTTTWKDLFQKYLLINILLLTVILSFMSGNVGLILRQKTILLPFIFLFIFYNPKNKMLPKILSPTAAG
jgi:hypothetical protein